MNDVIPFNSVIKHSTNAHLWYHILSATKEGDDYIIKYKLLFGEEKGPSEFIFNSSLKEFPKKERNFITQMIKLRNIVTGKKSSVVKADVNII
jgi:hypothetical protein